MKKASIYSQPGCATSLVFSLPLLLVSCGGVAPRFGVEGIVFWGGVLEAQELTELDHEELLTAAGLEQALWGARGTAE